MKRLLIFVVSLLLVISLFGCAENKGTNSGTDTSVSVSKSVKAGKIPEAKFSLGTDITILDRYYNDYLKREESEEIHGEIEEMVDYIDEGTTAYYIINNCYYYYNPENSGKGVGCIVNTSDSFGFEAGSATLNYVKASITDMECKESEINNETDLFFLFMSLQNTKKLVYNVGNYELKFIFENDYLIATVLTDVKNFIV